MGMEVDKVTTKERREALNMGQHEFLLYSLILEIGPKYLTGDELDKLLDCFLSVGNERRGNND